MFLDVESNMYKQSLFNKLHIVKKQYVVKNILFITLSNIGDAILTTPALEALHKQYPIALIDIVCDARSAIIFHYCPYVNRVLIKDKQSGWRGLMKLVLALRQKRYDVAVDLRTDGLLYLIKSKIKIFKCSNRSTIKMHSAEKHYAALKKIVTIPIQPARIWISEKEQMLANQVFNVYGQQRVLAIGLGANYMGKIWPASSFALLANALKNFFDLVILLGDKNDAILSEEFKSKCNLPVIDYCGKLTILESVAFLEKANLFVGNDSGLGHLAGSIDIATFTIFGVGEPSRYLPWSKSALWYQDPGFEINSVNHSIIAKMITSSLLKA